jgi:aspartate aminotransferase-like enzyme
MYPEELYPGSFIYGRIRPEKVEQILDNHREYTALVITSPTPEGIVSDVEKIAEICQEHEVVLIVDESFGAHFPF